MGWSSTKSECLPPFIVFDVIKENYYNLNPEENNDLFEPEHFGDNWDELLERDELRIIKDYFLSIKHLFTFLDFINIKVGGQDNVIEFNTKKFNKGITFETPRNSLVTACKYRIFDDLIIGNFMKTTLHGKWPHSKLYPDFIPYVAKYADNGGVRTKEELKAYFAYYKSKDFLGYLMHSLNSSVLNFARGALDPSSRIFKSASKAYYFSKGIFRI